MSADINPETKINWQAPEFMKYERSLLWYLIFFIVGGLLLAYAIYTSNFLFAIILTLIAIVLIFSSFRQPRNFNVEIGQTGIKIGTRNYPYSQFRNFSIVYQPPEINTLYIEFKAPLRERLSLSMGELNPNQVRSYLLQYIIEDLEREEESLTDILSRILRF